MNLQIKLFLRNLIRFLESEENIPQIPVNQTCKSFCRADTNGSLHYISWKLLHLWQSH